MNDCIFCRIIRNEVPSIRVYEDDNTLALLTIQPITTGHTLVMPKQHVANIFDASPEVWARVQEAVRKVAGAVERGMHADGVNINNNNREHAGQSVDHIHIHVIPRFKGDGITLWPHHDRRDDEGEPVAEKIRKALS